MSETTRLGIENAFNLFYLVAIWGLVAAMAYKLHRLPSEERPLGRLFITTFALLAVGDR